MTSSEHLTNLQLQLINMFNYELSEDQLHEVKDVLSNYFSNQVTSQVDQFFNENAFGEEKIIEWSKEHMRKTKK